MNLTGLHDPFRIVEENFYDSLQLLPYLNEDSSVLDVGSGAGFPGIPLKIAKSGIHLTICEPILKRCLFMREVIRSLRLANISVLQQRVNPGESIGQFDRIVSRGTMKADELINLVRSSLSPQGEILMLKGGDVRKEVDTASKEAVVSKNQIEVIPYTLPASAKIRSIIKVMT